MEILCLFDLDGTLTDPKEGITNSFAYALKAFHLAVPDASDLLKYIGPPLRESFGDFVPAGQIEAAVAKFREYYTVTGLLENRLYDGMIDLLRKLKADGAMLAIATSKVTEYAEKIASHFGFREYFDFISGCEMDGTRSAKDEVIEYALQKMNPENKITTVMIGDRKHDIIGAKKTGIDSIGITWGYGSRQELAEAGAGRIADTPEELYRMLGQMNQRYPIPN
jgi:phosphoglycolate phosphatase